MLQSRRAREYVWSPSMMNTSLDRRVTFTSENEKKLNEMKNYMKANVPDQDFPWKALLQKQLSSSSKDDTDCQAEGVFLVGDLDEEEYMLSQTQYRASLASQGSGSQHQLSQSILEAVLPLKEVLETLEQHQTATQIDLPVVAMSAFITCSPELLESLCMELSIDKISNVVLAELCQELLKPGREMGFEWCTSFVRCCFLKRVRELQAGAPRRLHQTIAEFAQQYQSATVEGFMAPCVCEGSSGTFQYPQRELASHLFASCLSSEHQSLFLRLILGRTLDWNENVVDLLSSVLETKFEFTAELLELLTSRLVDSTLGLSNSLKLCKFIKKLLQKISVQMAVKQYDDLKVVLERNKSFLKRSCLEVLKKCLQT